MDDNQSLTPSALSPHDRIDVERQKQQALSILNDLWDDASMEGIDLDCLSHAALFQALSSLVLVYGEEAVADFSKSLPERILSGDYSLERKLQ